MSWSVGFDPNWRRDIGYGVPAQCDHPDCEKHIDRGLSYVCGGEPYGGEKGCGLYFCSEHLSYVDGVQLCPRCAKRLTPYPPKPDTYEWVLHKLSDLSWQQWRAENPEQVSNLHESLSSLPKDPERLRDWQEDFSHENGNYLNKCTICDEMFEGHKRRVVCRVCATASEKAGI